jgi:hypothetical protein
VKGVSSETSGLKRKTVLALKERQKTFTTNISHQNQCRLLPIVPNTLLQTFSLGDVPPDLQYISLRHLNYWDSPKMLRNQLAIEIPSSIPYAPNPTTPPLIPAKNDQADVSISNSQANEHGRKFPQSPTALPPNLSRFRPNMRAICLANQVLFAANGLWSKRRDEHLNKYDSMASFSIALSELNIVFRISQMFRTKRPAQLATFFWSLCDFKSKILNPLFFTQSAFLRV